jgi:osmotically-inducible protein OsmY
MHRHPSFHARIYILAVSVVGCATDRPCRVDGCPTDAAITAKVRALMDGHSELGPPGAVEVQTINRVVYLSGFVNSGLERQIAGSVAHEAPEVTRVINSITVTR